MKKIAFGVLLFLASGLFVTPTSTAANSVIQPRAYEEIARCLNSKNILNVYFLVDSSGSLQNTDPKDKRAEVLSSALAQFANAREGATVNFALGTFGEQFTAQYPWTNVKGSSLNSARNWIEEQVPDLDTEDYTDWLAGIRNATKALNSAPQSADSCKIMLWLTDGGINLPGSTRDVDASAIATLCGVGPNSTTSSASSLMDSIRRSGITVIGVLLKSKADLARMKRDDPDEYAMQVSTMSYMRPIVEGTGQVDGSYFGQGDSQFNCGESPIPASYSAGVLVEVNDANDLGLNFARIWLNASGGQPGSVIGTSPFNFTVEPGVSSVVVLIQAKDWSLKDPSGKVVATSKGASDPRVNVLKTGNVSQVSIDTSQSSAQGNWNGTGPTLVELFLYSNLGIDLNTDIQFGQPAQISGQILDQDGNPTGLSDFGSASVSVVVIAEGFDGQPVQLQLDPTTGRFSGEFAPPAGVTRAIFDVTLKLTTKSGQALKPIERRIEQDVALGAEFPKLTPSRVQFTELAGPDGTATGILKISGSAQGPSTVCFDKAVVAHDPMPDRIPSYVWSVNDDKGCITVNSGETKELQISVRNPEGAEGFVDGTLGISVTPQGGQKQVFQVPFEMQSTWPPNQLVRTLVLVLLTLLSILLPWLVLHLVNVRNSRLVAGSLMKRVEIPVLVSGMGVRGPVTPENKNPSTLDIQAKDYSFIGREDRPREYKDPSGFTLSGKASLNPFGSPRVVVSPLSGHQIITKPMLDTDLGGAWLVILSNSDLIAANGAEMQGKLVSFIRTTGDDVALAQSRNSEISASAVWQNLSTYVDAANAEVANVEVANSQIEKRLKKKLFKNKDKTPEPVVAPVVEEQWGGSSSISGGSSPSGTVGGASDPWGSATSGTENSNNNDDTGFDWSR